MNRLFFFSVLLLLTGCSGNRADDQLIIAYNVFIDQDRDNYEVFTMNLDGSDKRNITNLDGVEWTYTSFQDQVYFISDKDTCHRCYFLYRTDRLGNRLTKISDTRLADSWMGFHGERIIVRPHRSVDSVFHIIDTEGKLLQRLDTGLPSAFDPVFVNDGQQVAFRGGTKRSKREEGYREEIYLINIDGSGLLQLSHYPEADTTAPWYAYKAGQPRQHPTEKFISFASFRDGKYSLYAVTTDASREWKLTDNELWEVWHDWSPDGNWLVTDLTDSNEQEFDIGLMDWRTQEWSVLTDSTYQFEQSPNFVLKARE